VHDMLAQQIVGVCSAKGSAAAPALRAGEEVGLIRNCYYVISLCQLVCPPAHKTNMVPMQY